MDPVRASLSPKGVVGKGGKTAQVVVYLGEGPQKCSVTRHLVRKGGKWMGRNPDEAAVALLDRAEAELKAARESHELIVSLALIKLEDLKMILGRMRQFRERARGVPSGLVAIAEDVLLSELVPAVKTVQGRIRVRLTESAAVLQAAEKRVAELQASTPREREFSFQE